ncbi:MAG: hypothetical protein HYS38_05305 [Acidobacteria bacterium]|nr:hypothetical protein [Acidobacteriota bacterium]
MFSPAKTGIDEQLKDFTDQFATYVSAFDKNPPFKQEQLESHLRTLELRLNSPTAYNAACNEKFAHSLRETRRSWGIGTQGAELVSPTEFHNQLCRVASMLAPLESHRIDDRTNEVKATACLIWEIITRLNIAIARKTKEPVRNKVVSGTKALHHLLPDLVFPIDREYTQTFFKWSTDFDKHPEECFKFGFQAVSEVARRAGLARYRGTGWRTSLAKILDNAIVGYDLVHGLKSEQRKQRERNKYLIQLGRKAKAEGYGSN